MTTLIEHRAVFALEMRCTKSMKEKTCCFTGHRTLPKEKLPEIIRRLETVIEELIQQGVIYYGCGGATGIWPITAACAWPILSTGKAVPDIL